MQIPLKGDPSYDGFKGARLLDRALAVVRFSPVLTIADENGVGIASFQDAVRSLYPFAQLEHEQAIRFEVRQDGTIESYPERQAVWRLQDKQRQWRVSLTPISIALEVNAAGYNGWSEFSGRMAFLLDNVENHFRPAVLQNIGVRIVNLSSIENGQDPRPMCAKELVSITGNSALNHADLNWQFTVDEGVLILRSGLLAPGSTYDPNVIEPRTDRNWYLDIDVINTDIQDFDASRIKQAIDTQSKRVRAVYAWAMSGEQGNTKTYHDR